MTNRPMRAFAVAGAFMVATILATPSAIAASSDGYWRLVAQTTDGHCGVTQWDVAISNGRIHYPGGFFMGQPVALGGAVFRSGRVRVNVAAGPRVARGAGRLGRFEGRGEWAGQGPSGSCSGIWTAMRVQPGSPFGLLRRDAYGWAPPSQGMASQTPRSFQIEQHPAPFRMPFR